MKKFKFLFFLFITQFIFSQSLSIKITDSSGKNLAGINVQLQKNGRTLKFLKSNELGICIFDNIERGFYEIKVTSLSYKTQILEIDSNIKNNFTIVLQTQITEIETVKIKARPKFGKIVGDTISYNISAVTDGTERTAEDVIKKLPGMDITANGKVTYKGTALGQVLVDGNELFGNNHKLSTQNITSEMLSGIDLWQKYTTINGTQSSALNLKLKDEYKNKITGNIEADGGYKNYYSAHSNLFKFSKKGNLALILDANNIAKDPISLMDFYEMNSQENTNKNSGEITFDTPSFLNNDGKVKTKNNQFGALQYSTSSKKFSLSIFSIFNVAQLSKFSETQRLAFAGQPTSFNFLENTNENNKGFFGTTQIKFRKNLKNNSFFYYNLIYNPTDDNFGRNINRFSDVNSFFNINEKSNIQTLNNLLSFNKILDNFTFKLVSTNLLSTQNKDLNITSDTPLFFTNSETIWQKTNNRSSKNALDFYLSNSNNLINIDFHSGFEVQDYRINLKQITAENYILKLNYYLYTNELSLQKSIGSFDLNSALTSKFLEVSNLRKYYYEPYFRVKYRSDNSWFNFSLQYSSIYKMPEFNSLNTSELYTKDLNVISNEELQPQMLNKENSYKFRWSRTDLNKGYVTFFNVSYTTNAPIFTTNTTNFGNFSQIKNVYGKNGDSWFFTFSDSRLIFKHFNISSNLFYTKSSSNNFIIEMPNILNSQNVQIQQKFSSRFEKIPVQFAIGYSYQYSKYSQQLFASTSNLSNTKFFLEIRSQINNELKINTLSEYFIQKSNSINLKNILLGGQISYKKNTSKIEYNFLFNNLLNLKSFQYLSSFITSNGVENSSIVSLRGYILAGLKFSL